VLPYCLTANHTSLPPSTEEGDGVDLIADLLRANPEVGVLILSASLDTASIERAAEADEIMD
jgi:hypothetical protein